MKVETTCEMDDARKTEGNDESHNLNKNDAAAILLVKWQESLLKHSGKDKATHHSPSQFGRF